MTDEQPNDSPLFDIRRGERAVAALMGLYFFLVITSFWILKPIKKTLFIDQFATSGFEIAGYAFTAPEAEQLAKVLNMVVAAVAATVFALLSRRLRRQQLTYVFTAFFIASYGAFAIWLTPPSSASVWGFYLFGDLFTTLMVAAFFSFLNDSVSPDAAKRLYGLVGFGGVLGGVFGSSAVAVWIDALSPRAWLGIAALLGLAILGVAAAAAAALERSGMLAEAEARTRAEEESTAGDESTRSKSGALAGFGLVFRSRYLLSIVMIVGLYELVSTILDFQFTSAIFAFSADAAARSQNYATVFATTNWVSMTVQLLLTSFVMRRFGLSVALLALPLAIVASSMGFLLVPGLLLGGLLSVSDNALNYSINQSSKEALYVPTTREEKYQAKAFIDMFVQRFAKALGVGLGLVVAATIEGLEAIRMLSLIVMPIVVVWGGAAYYAGRRFRELEESRATLEAGRG